MPRATRISALGACALVALWTAAAGRGAGTAGGWTRRGLGAAVCADLASGAAFVAAEGGDVGALALEDGGVGRCLSHIFQGAGAACFDG